MPRRALIILFTHLDDAEANSQLAQAVRLLRPRHLPIVVAVQDADIQEIMASPAENQSQLFAGLAAGEYRRAVEQSKFRLERLGASIIEATPDKIEDALLARYRSLRERHQI